MTNFRILNYYALAFSHPSGVTQAIREWSTRLSESGNSLSVVGAQGRLPADHYEVPSRRVQHRGNSRASLRPDTDQLASAIRESDFVVLHEGWTISNLMAARVAQQLKVPYCVVPHGVYEPHVLRTLKGPLRLRTHLESWTLRHAAFVHVFHEGEVPLIRAIARGATCLVAPTGVEPAPPTETQGPPNEEILWFGRMDVEHKGLDILLHAIKTIERSRRPKLTLAGYDYHGGRATIERWVHELDLRSNVRVVGEIRGSSKQKALETHGLYVHPSRWECHSIALLEVLSTPMTVAVSDSIQISGLLRDTGAAHVVTNSVPGWAGFLRNDWPLVAQNWQHDSTRSTHAKAGLWAALDWTTQLKKFEQAVSATLNAPLDK